MKPEIVNKILNETESGYDLVAEKFSETRKHFWRDLEFIADYVESGDKVLDFGCGNGRLLDLFSGKDTRYVGVDVSQKLLDSAEIRHKGENINFLKISSSQTTLPFPNDYFNTAYSIAVFHHLPKEYARLIAKDLQRILSSGGCVIITVWNLWQKRYLKYVFENWIKKMTGRSELDWNDCYVPFSDNQGNVFRRYHHAWKKRELRDVFSGAGFEILSVKKIGKNIVLVAKKAI